MKGIVDFHTHAFPDEIAERAIGILEREGNIKARLDGKVSSLLASMDAFGIEKSIVCSIATKPSQFDSILSWSKKIRSERIIPFPSFHPDDSDFRERVARVKGEGFLGIKFHPYYQDFDIDEERLFPIYEEIAKNELIVVMHTGFDFAFPRVRKADPLKISRIKGLFPELRLVTTHLGSWDDWDEVENYLIGKDIYMEISFSLELLNKERARKMILRHPSTHILFGTDSPWTDQGETLSLLKELGLDEEREKMILSKNAMRLLQLQ
ncbi:MAG: amidohydrolase family protein [Thermodesulfovibrionales bacterium]